MTQRGKRVPLSPASSCPHQGTRHVTEACLEPSEYPRGQLNSTEGPPVDSMWSVISYLLAFLTLKIVSYNNHGCCFNPVSFSMNQSSTLIGLPQESQIWAEVLSTQQQSPVESVYTDALWAEKAQGRRKEGRREVKQERRERKCQVVHITEWPQPYRNTACPMGHLWGGSIE